jgi:transposase-like protein
MAKYRKEISSARTKRRVFGLKQPAVEDCRSYVDALTRSHIQKGLQDSLEVERDEIVGRSWHAHHREGVPLQYRNGYGDPRCLTCGSGTVEIRMPRLRESYESKIVAKYERLTPEMRDLLPQLYLHGLALGDFEQAFGWLLGEDAPLSANSMLRLKGPWEEQYREWKSQPLEKEYLYVWADGIYPKGGAVDETLALLVVVGVDRKGCKRLLALEEGYRESEESWTDLFRDLKRRGGKWIGLVIGDGIDGLWKAVRTIFPMSRHQRCWVHKMRNILDKVPTKAHDEVLEYLRLIYHAKSYNDAQRLKQEFMCRYRTLYPKAVKSLQEAGEALLTYFDFPKRHWVHLKTTNPIESLFATVRLRTRAARRIRTRLGTVCLVFHLLRNSERRLRRIRGYGLVADTIDQLQSRDFKKRKAA